MVTDNWVYEEKDSRKKAMTILKKVKTERRKRKFELVKVRDMPLTYIEKEVH